MIKTSLYRFTFSTLSILLVIYLWWINDPSFSMAALVLLGILSAITFDTKPNECLSILIFIGALGLLSKSLFVALFAFEIGILVLGGIKAFKGSLFSFIPLSLILIILGRDPGLILSYDSSLAISFLVLFRLLYFYIEAKTEGRSWFTYLAFAQIFSVWWTFSQEYLLYLVGLVAFIEVVIPLLRLKKSSFGNAFLISFIFLSIVFKTNALVLLLCVFNQMLCLGVKRQNSISKQEIVFLIVSILSLMGELLYGMNMAESLYLVGGFVFPWLVLFSLDNYKIELKEKIWMIKIKTYILCTIGMVIIVIG